MWEVFYDKTKELYQTKKFDECIPYCYRLLKNIKDNFFTNNKIFYIYFMLSVSYQMKEIMMMTMKAIKYINIASKYAINYTDKMRVDWQLGWCYEQIDKNKSIDHYRKALFICCNYVNNEECAILLISDLARLNEDEQGVIDAIENYKNVSNNIYYINQLHEYLCKFYIEQNQLEKAEIVLHNITDSDLINKLRSKMSMQNKIAETF